jgi:hypothetical protein
MGKKELQRVEMVRIYHVREYQRVEELDSPASGATQVIAEKEVVYEFFHRRTEADDFLEGRRLALVRENGMKTKSGSKTLEGQVNHRYAHVYEVSFDVVERTVPESELPRNVDELLLRPERRIVRDIKRTPEPYPGMPEEPATFELF